LGDDHWRVSVLYSDASCGVKQRFFYDKDTAGFNVPAVLMDKSNKVKEGFLKL